MSTYLKMENKDKEKLVELTEHTLESVEEREDKIDENTIFLAETFNGIEVESKLNFVDDSDEGINLTKISSSGRYRVAVGPRIINAGYPDSGNIWDGYDDIYRCEAGNKIKK
ncbi:MAG: hypothetical protein ACK5LV_07870 [Lachnospirales bacterium]